MSAKNICARLRREIGGQVGYKKSTYFTLKVMKIWAKVGCISFFSRSTSTIEDYIYPNATQYYTL